MCFYDQPSNDMNGMPADQREKEWRENGKIRLSPEAVAEYEAHSHTLAIQVQQQHISMDSMDACEWWR